MAGWTKKEVDALDERLRQFGEKVGELLRARNNLSSEGWDSAAKMARRVTLLRTSLWEFNDDTSGRTET